MHYAFLIWYPLYGVMIVVQRWDVNSELKFALSILFVTSLLFNYLNKAIESELVPIHDNAKTLNKNESKYHKAQT